MSQQTPMQHLASIANAQKSTGPKTEEGKAASSQNALKHGFSSRFALLPWEEPEEYYELFEAFAGEFPWESAAERELLDSLVQARWLVRRAILMQEFCFDPKLPAVIDPSLALYLRYQTTHERSFQKAYAALQKIKTGREKKEIAAARQEANQQLGFVLQKRQLSTELRKQEQHEATLRVKNATVRLTETRILMLQQRIPLENRAPAAAQSVPIAA